jgi:hypothetical protein
MGCLHQPDTSTLRSRRAKETIAQSHHTFMQGTTGDPMIVRCYSFQFCPEPTCLRQGCSTECVVMPKMRRRARAALVGRGTVSEFQHTAELGYSRGQQNFRESLRANDTGISPIVAHENDCPRIRVPCLLQQALGDRLQPPKNALPRGKLRQGHKKMAGCTPLCIFQSSSTIV